MVPHIGNQENKINTKRMAHSKEYLTIVKWETTDKRLFDTQEEADVHQKAVDRDVASSLAGKYLSNYFGLQWNEIKLAEENFAVSEQRINEAIIKRNSISNRLRKLQNIAKPSSDEKKQITEYESQIEQLNGDINKLQKSLADDKSKFESYMSGLYLPLLDAYTPYQSPVIFAGNHAALKDLVIDNTAKFLSIVSQIMSETGLGGIKLGRSNWWSSEDDEAEFPARENERIAMKQS